MATLYWSSSTANEDYSPFWPEHRIHLVVYTTTETGDHRLQSHSHCYVQKPEYAQKNMPLPDELEMAAD